MYSLMSMRTMFSSESKSDSASVPRQLGLADAGRAEEDERADGPLRILDARPSADDRVSDQLDRFVLTDDPRWRISSRRSQLLRSPSTSLVTGMPVHLETISAISSSVTSSRSSLARVSESVLLHLRGQLLLELGAARAVPCSSAARG